MEELSFLDKRDRRVVAMALAACSLIGLGIGVDHFVSKAQAAESHELSEKIDRLSTRLDQFNTRLSWLEGATNGTLHEDRK